MLERAHGKGKSKAAKSSALQPEIKTVQEIFLLQIVPQFKRKRVTLRQISSTTHQMLRAKIMAHC